MVFYNQRNTCEQFIREGKGAVKRTRLSSRTFGANAVRLQLHALAYNLRKGRGQMDAAVMPDLCCQRSPSPASRAGIQIGQLYANAGHAQAAEPWSLTSLREKLIKIGAKIVTHGRYVTFQMAEVAVRANEGGGAPRWEQGRAFVSVRY